MISLQFKGLSRVFSNTTHLKIISGGKFCIILKMYPDFLGGPVVRTSVFSMQGAWVPSLVGELRFCMPCGTPKKKKEKNIKGKKRF